MRLLILILLIANALVFTWIQWGQPAPLPEPKEINPDKIHIVRDDEPAQPEAPVAKVGSAPKTEPVVPPTPTPTPTPTPAIAIAATKPAITLCATWGPIPAQRVEDAQIRLNKLKLGERLNVVDTPIHSGPYWVYLPPFKSKADADNKVVELQNSGIKDIAVVRDGKWENAISMGLYGKAAIANDRIAKLKKQGINAQIEARGKTARTFALHHLTDDEVKQIKQMQTDFGGPAIKKTTCE